MPDEVLWIDHATDATGSPLRIGPGSSYDLVSHAYPAPEQDVMYASSVDSEGEFDVSRRYRNRVISIELEFADPTGTLLAALQGKYSKLQREGGSIRRTYKDGTTIRVYDAITASGWDPGFDLTYYLGDVVKVTLTLPAKPLARGAAVTQPDRVETTLPVLIATETGITGDYQATGRLVVDNDAGSDWYGLLWGIETDRYYTFTDSTGSGALFYQAESRTAVGGSATAVGIGASGAGSNVMVNSSLLTDYKVILSTQATGGGAHLSHVGSFNVWARVWLPDTSSGDVSVALEYGVGDFRRFTRNPARTVPLALSESWVLVELGPITIPKIEQGLQRWEGRLIAKSTVDGDDVEVDFLMLEPHHYASGIASAVRRLPTFTDYVASDDFTATTVGVALNARVAPIGGTWATSGDATDLAFADDLGGEQLKRTVASATNGRFAVLGTATYTNVTASAYVDVGAGAGTTGSGRGGIVARYVDNSNYALARIRRQHSSAIPAVETFEIVTVVAGVATTVAAVYAGVTEGVVTFSIMPSGDAQATLTTTLGVEVATVSGWSSALAGGGTLTTGKVGLHDFDSRSTPGTRYYDAFHVWVSPVDAAVYAGQSIEIRSDGVIREDSGGSFWQPPSSYVGSYLRVPVAGAEARSARFLVKPLISDPSAPGVYPDNRIDDLSARLTYDPRYLT